MYVSMHVMHVNCILECMYVCMYGLYECMCTRMNACMYVCICDSMRMLTDSVVVEEL